MRNADGRKGLLWQRLLAAAVAAALLSTLAPSLASPYSEERMEKDIAIMENVINTAMVESELVYIFTTHNNVRGLYIPEFGALFTVQVQLITDWAAPWFNYYYFTPGKKGSPLWGIYRYDKDKLKKIVEKMDITVNGKKLDLEEYLEDLHDYERDDERSIKIEKKKQEMIEENVENFKDELAGLVADYGGTIRQLEDNQWVMIVAYLDRSPKAVPISKIMVKAKKSDIDLYDHGKIDYEELKSRMMIEAQ